MKTLALRAPISVVVVWVLCLLTNPLWAADPIEGRWVKSSGDVIIELKVVDGMLIGHLLAWKNKQWTVDSKNPDKSLRKRPLKGLRVLSCSYKKDNEWRGGKIYDASEGESYRARVRLSGKNELIVRGLSLIHISEPTRPY